MTVTLNPVSNTFPVFSNVAVVPKRSFGKVPVSVQVPVPGLTKADRATSTSPFARIDPKGLKSGLLELPVTVQRPKDGSKSSALTGPVVGPFPTF